MVGLIMMIKEWIFLFIHLMTIAKIFRWASKNPPKLSHIDDIKIEEITFQKCIKTLK